LPAAREEGVSDEAVRLAVQVPPVERHTTSVQSVTPDERYVTT
jgi:hypothetical protein